MRRRRIRFIAFSLIALFLLGVILVTGYQPEQRRTFQEEGSSSTASPEDTSDWLEYVNKKPGISFKYPPNWKEQPQRPFTGLSVEGARVEFNNGGSYLLYLQWQRNYDQFSDGPYERLEDTPYAGDPYEVGLKEIRIDEERALSEDKGYIEHELGVGGYNTSVLLFSKNKANILILGFTIGGKDEETITSGLKIFDRILSTVNLY